ncbi:MAG: hypothetical protein GX648_10040, partial [Crenarchaeota archaeon]|nr:hypothetical protein [Thermoproteota archaeon]
LMKNKKAFSAIIAALILMLIAVAAGVVVYAYVMGWIGGVQTNPPGQGIITIDSVSNDLETVYVRNAGTIPVTLSAVYIDGIQVLDDTYIDVGEVVEIDISSETPTESGSYVIKVVCTDGTTVSTTAVLTIED